MTKHISRCATVAVVGLLHAVTLQAQQAFDSSAWDIHAAEWRVEPYRGRSALFLRDGTAWLKGSRFQNGTIEFDIVFSNVGGFPGVAFRAATHSEFELFYLRQSLGDRPHATQYTPVLHGLDAWQIYTGPVWEGAAHWAYDRWMHVKVFVHGGRAALFVDGDTVVQIVGQLRGPNVAGEIGLLSGTGARFANVIVRPEVENAPTLTATLASAERDSTPPTVVHTWRVSAPFTESTLGNLAELTRLPVDGGWKTLDIEERGIANLARLAGNVPPGGTFFSSARLTSIGTASPIIVAEIEMASTVVNGSVASLRYYIEERLWLL